MRLRTRIYDDPSSDRFRIGLVDKEKPIDLSGSDPTLVWIMGGFQTEDVIERTPNQVNEWLKSGQAPLLNEYIHKMNPGATRAAVVQYLTPGVDKMSRDYFQFADEVYGQHPQLRNSARKMYAVSHDRVEDSFINRPLFHQNVNGFITEEGTDFVKNTIAPYLGDFTMEKDSSGKDFIYINRRNKTKDIVHQLQKLCVVGNSAGGEFVINKDNAAQKTYRESGFSEADQYEIAKCMRNVIIGNLFPVEQLRGPRPTTIVFEGIRDLVAESVNPYKTPVYPAQIDRHAPKACREALKHAVYAHYLMAEDILTDTGSMVPTPEHSIFDDAPFLIFQKLSPNALKIITDVPTHRARWRATSSDALAHEMKKVSNDGNGHHTAFYIVQGDPPHHLPLLVHGIMIQALNYPNLSPREKCEFKVENLLKRPSQNHISSERLLKALIRKGLDRAEVLYTPEQPLVFSR